MLNGLVGTLRRNRTSWKRKSDHRWLLPTLSRGDQKAFDTGRTKSSWTSSKASTSSYAQSTHSLQAPHPNTPFIQVNANGNVIRSEILGAVKMKCYLSGMPELRLGLNDKVMFESTGRTSRGKAIEMEDVKFHQCVRLSRFENDRTISFIPPDGEFELMSYRLSTPVKPLIWVEAAVESHKGSRVEYMVKVKAQFKRRSTANNVEIYVPVPDDADSPKFRVGLVEDSIITWSLTSGPRQRPGAYSTLLTSQRSSGRSSSLEVVASSSCGHTSVSPA